MLNSDRQKDNEVPGIKDNKIKAVISTITSNVAQCCLNLQLFEDALISSNLVLDLDPGHEKSLYRKAKALACLSKFQESINIFEELGQKEKEVA